MTLALWLAASYFLGAIPTSYWVARAAKGIDLRQVGSRNLGATNLYRTLGWSYAIPVGLFDVAKGVIPVMVFGPRAGPGPWAPLACGVVAVLGHAFSVFVRFRGGKGVATATGVVLGLVPLAALVAAAIWIAVVRLTGYVSLASMLAAAALPPLGWVLHPGRRDLVWFLAALGLFVIAMHRANIRRLVAGTENRFGRRGTAGPAAE
jgi:glycerol-3-phosphate acyltransferase PlsY